MFDSLSHENCLSLEKLCGSPCLNNMRLMLPWKMQGHPHLPGLPGTGCWGAFCEHCLVILALMTRIVGGVPTIFSSCSLR